MTHDYIVAMPKDSVPVTSKQAIRAQTLHFLTTCFCQILYVLVLFITVIFGYPTCLLQLCVRPPFLHHEYPYAKALVADPAYLRGLWVRIPPWTWMSVCCECCVLTGRGLCDWPIPRSEESCRVWSRKLNSEAAWPQEKKALDTCCPPFVSYTISCRYKPCC